MQTFVRALRRGEQARHDASAMLDHPELPNLLARVALRDQAAFRQLYDLASAHLFGVAMRILRNPSLAEEALQDAFVQIWQNAKTFQAGRGNPGAWLTSLARYRALDLVRKSGRETPLDEVPESAIPTVALAAAAHSEPKLGPCLAGLAAEPRDCITMAFVEGYSHQELSHRMKVPLGTVKSWIRRGLQQLKECLER